MSDFLVQDGQTYLFQGDSITDCGRRNADTPMGSGYALMFTEIVTALYPGRKINFINRGISGDTTKDLIRRWDDDMVALQPDWMSILIGINDSHRYLFVDDPEVKVSPSEFRENYDFLLQRATTETKAQIVLLEPFYICLACDDADRTKVLDLLPEYIQITRDMSAKYGTLLVPMQNIYQKHLALRDATSFCPEPVHPNHGGHMAMALELLRTLGAQL